MKFYTYLWLREDGTPYYVGKGCGNRAFYRRKKMWPKPPADVRRIVVNYWTDEETAFAYERYFIDFYGREDLGTGCLRNMSDGGDGLKNPSAETIRRLSVSHTNPSDEVREKMRRAWREPTVATRARATASLHRFWKSEDAEKTRETIRSKNSASGAALWKDVDFRARIMAGIARRKKKGAVA